MAWMKVASCDELADDEAKSVDVGELKLALFRSGSNFYATDAVCTHQYALLSEGYVEDGCVECPLHQARFNLRTGEAMCAPATKPIRVYPIKVDGGDLLVDV